MKPIDNSTILRPSAGPGPWWAEIVPLTFGRARIILTDGDSVQNSW